jgi:4'-phosphopantetheinyl transferase
VPWVSFLVRRKGGLLEGEDVHVWFSLFDDLTPHFDSLFATLAADEIEKARRFRFRTDRDKYVLGRGFLRQVLSRSSGVHPAKLQFRYGVCGKPALVGESGEVEITFNLSHSHRAVICVVARGRQVGVDLEYLRPDIDDQELAERFFSPRDAAVLAQLPLGDRRTAFLTCWTRKEAYIKAKGDGLSLDLRSFDVLDSSDDRAPRLQVESDPGEAARWMLADLQVPAGYVAALAVEGSAERLTCRHRFREHVTNLDLYSYSRNRGI